MIKEITVLAKNEMTDSLESEKPNEEQKDPSKPIKPIEEQKPTTNEKDKTPTTGLGNTAIMLLSVVMIISLAGIVIFKKTINKKY